MKITPIEIRNEKHAGRLMLSLGISKEGARILSPKSIYSVFKVEGIRSHEANIIKQHLLSLGTDAAIERKALIKNISTQSLIFGNLNQLRKLCKKLQNQPFNLKNFSNQLSYCLANVYKQEFIFCARNKKLKIKKPIICGIINLTNNSFSGDGLMKQAAGSLSKIKSLALTECEKAIKKGAKIIDLGGESSRPFSKKINEKDEKARVIPVLKALRKEFKKILISVDTYKYALAKASADSGVDIINDITALRGDLRIASLIKKYKLGCILMHMKGEPKNMQVKPEYKNVVEEQIDFFKKRLEFCSDRGIKKEQIFIDPGIGFGKRLQDNIQIINELYKFKIFGLPIFLGLSRKSFIGQILNVEIKDRLIGTVAANIIALTKGANVLRVHDVKEAIQAVKIVSKIIGN